MSEGFSKKERETLLLVPYVGEKIIQRLEELGISSFATLSEADAVSITHAMSEILGSTCWKNSPQARKAIENAITCAKTHIMR